MIGDNNTSYKYINKNVFDNKINYSYSKFGGIEFIRSWDKKRKECLDILLDGSEVCYEIIDNSLTNIEFKKWLSSPKTLFSELDKVHLLIKRFEVTKKIYQMYDGDYRRLNKDAKHDNLNLYINFGFVIAKLYHEFRHIQYLNTLLKIIDIICSRLVELSSKKEASYYGAAIILISKEKKIINALCKHNNIDI